MQCDLNSVANCFTYNNTWGMFQKWLISATGIVLVAHPQQSSDTYVGFETPLNRSMNAANEAVLSHYVKNI